MEALKTANLKGNCEEKHMGDVRTMAMAMPNYGAWPWPCLGTPDQGPSSVEKKEREIGQPASLKKQSPVT